MQVRDMYAKENDALKEEVKRILLATTNYKPTDKIKFINTLERLGVSYHFEKEIEKLLQQMFDAHAKFQDNIQDFDLFTLGVYFRILRQHGYKISCGKSNEFILLHKYDLLDLYINDFTRT